jgi:hypothetical protein
MVLSSVEEVRKAASRQRRKIRANIFLSERWPTRRKHSVGIQAESFTPLQLGAELACLRNSAQRLVTTPWAQMRIVQIADALLRHGTLIGEQIFAEVTDETDLRLITAAEFNCWSGRAGRGR